MRSGGVIGFGEEHADKIRRVLLFVELSISHSMVELQALSRSDRTDHEFESGLKSPGITAD